MADPSLATVLLSDPDAELEAEFVPGAGMLCCSLRHRSEELLAQNAGLAAYAERGKTMGIPLLYPWANRLAAFDYSVGGRTVEVPDDRTCVSQDSNGLPIHGVIGSRIPWELEVGSGQVGSGQVGSSSDAHSLAAHVSWSDSHPQLFEVFQVFPFRHELDYEARLLDGRLEIDVTVHACGEDSVPVAFGFHPYFAPPGAPRESWLIELAAMRHLTLDEQQIPTGFEPAQPARRFELDGHEFDDGFDSVAQSARFAVQDAARRIEVELLEGYPCAQVFAPPGGQFICFEPMTAPANALRSGDGLRLLAAGERHRARFSVSVRGLSSG